MTEPIDYKEFADRFYNLLKENAFYRGLPEFHQVVKDYENSTKPKMTRCAVMRECLAELVDYNNQTYALFYNNWYKVVSSKLFLLEPSSFICELNEAYEEYKNSKR